MGIISSGVGVGMLLVVPLTQLLIDAFGWRAAFRALGLVAALWIVPSSLWLRRLMLRHREARSPDPGPGPASRAPERPGAEARPAMTLGEAARTQPFWLLMAMFFFGNVSSQTLHVHQVAFLVDHGLAAIVAASVVGVVGVASIAGKTGGGWLSDRIEREAVYAAGIAIMVASAIALLAIGAAPGTPARWAAYGYAVLLGVGYSVTATIRRVQGLRVTRSSLSTRTRQAYSRARVLPREAHAVQ